MARGARRTADGGAGESHLRKTVASFLDDAKVSTHKISDQFGHAHVSMTQDRYRRRRLTDRQAAEVLEGMLGPGRKESG